jgi:hypothetical protein
LFKIAPTSKKSLYVLNTIPFEHADLKRAAKSRLVAINRKHRNFFVFLAFRIPTTTVELNFLAVFESRLV